MQLKDTQLYPSTLEESETLIKAKAAKEKGALRVPKAKEKEAQSLPKVKERKAQSLQKPKERKALRVQKGIKKRKKIAEQHIKTLVLQLTSQLLQLRFQSWHSSFYEANLQVKYLWLK